MMPSNKSVPGLRQPAQAILLAIGLGLTVYAHGGNPQRGLEKSEVCQACHGIDGNLVVDEDTPRLAGQHYDYLIRALKDYRDGVRDNAIMAGFTQDLSDHDIRDLAAWYASQKGLVELRIR